MAPLVFYGVLIFYLSSQPAPEEFPAFFLADKLAHILEYGGLGFLMVRFLSAIQKGRRESILISTLLCFFYGILDEIHQAFVDTRSFSFWDMAADLIGSFVGSWFYFFTVRLLGIIRQKLGKNSSDRGNSGR